MNATTALIAGLAFGFAGGFLLARCGYRLSRLAALRSAAGVYLASLAFGGLWWGAATGPDAEAEAVFWRFAGVAGVVICTAAVAMFAAGLPDAGGSQPGPPPPTPRNGAHP
jgi:hypothetical protein